MDVALLMVAAVATAHWHKLVSKDKFSILAISCVASTKLVSQTDCCMFSYVTRPCNQFLELTITHSSL